MRVFGSALGLVVALAVVVVVSATALVGLSGLGGASAHSSSVATPYTVTFNETGLPAGTTWGVHVAYIGCGCDGVHRTVTSTAPSISIPVANGTYRYNVLPVPGFFVNVSASGKFNVTGANVSPILVVFHPVVTFLVEFTETGLPPGTLWTVTVTGNGQGQERTLEDQTQWSYGTSLNFTLPNGTYHYTVARVAGSFFRLGSSHGKFNVTGASPPAIAVVFYTPPSYTLTFVESGLPLGADWSVRVAGWGGVPIYETGSSTTATLAFSLPNGTYHYILGEVLGFVVNGSAFGSVTIANASAEVSVVYQALAPGAFYNVTFEEHGLPGGTPWSVTVAATHTFGRGRLATQSSDGATDSFFLQNGTYRYSVHGVQGYVESGGQGKFTVNGSSPATLVVNFTALPTYSITFDETGLPNGTVWSVLVRSEYAGSTQWPVHLTGTSNSTTITFSVPAGAYCYRVEPVPGYLVTTGTVAGPFTLPGTSPAEISVGFTAKG